MREFFAALLWTAPPAVFLLCWPLNFSGLLLLAVVPMSAGLFHRSWETGMMAGIMPAMIILPFYLLIVLPSVVQF